MQVNPGIQDWFDKLQGRPASSGGGGGGQGLSANNALAQALAGIVRPEISSQQFHAPQLNPWAPPERVDPYPGHATTAYGYPVAGGMTPLRGSSSGGGDNLGGSSVAAGLGKLGQGLEQGLANLAAKRKGMQEVDAIRAGAGAARIKPLGSGSTGGASGASTGAGTGTSAGGSAGGSTGSGLSGDKLQDAAMEAGYGEKPGTLQSNSGANLGLVHPDLRAAIGAASNYLPSGYTVNATSGYGADHGDAGSQHRVAGGSAVDVQIIKPDGTPIPNRGADTTGLYGQLSQHVYGELAATDPALASKMRWGGNFGTSSSNPEEADLMHFDMGNNGNNSGHLGLSMQARGFLSVPNSPGYVGPAVADNTPTTPPVTSSAPPPTPDTSWQHQSIPMPPEPPRRMTDAVSPPDANPNPAWTHQAIPMPPMPPSRPQQTGMNDVPSDNQFAAGPNTLQPPISGAPPTSPTQDYQSMLASSLAQPQLPDQSGVNPLTLAMLLGQGGQPALPDYSGGNGVFGFGGLSGLFG